MPCLVSQMLQVTAVRLANTAQKHGLPTMTRSNVTQALSSEVPLVKTRTVAQTVLRENSALQVQTQKEHALTILTVPYALFSTKNTVALPANNLLAVTILVPPLRAQPAMLAPFAEKERKKLTSVTMKAMPVLVALLNANGAMLEHSLKQVRQQPQRHVPTVQLVINAQVMEVKFSANLDIIPLVVVKKTVPRQRLVITLLQRKLVQRQMLVREAGHLQVTSLNVIVLLDKSVLELVTRHHVAQESSALLVLVLKAARLEVW